MKVLITGGTSFIASKLVPAIIRDGHKVLTPTRKEFDLTNLSQVERYVQDNQPNLVIHLAGLTRTGESFSAPNDYNIVNYIGTTNLAEACRKHLPSLMGFIFPSTLEVYGETAKTLSLGVTEKDPTKPNSPFSISKKACEDYLNMMFETYHFPVIILRQATIYGRTTGRLGLIESIISQMLTSDKIYLGEKTPTRQVIHIDALVDLYIRVINQLKRGMGQTFNVCSGVRGSILKLAEDMAIALQWRGEIFWDSFPPRPGEIYNLACRPDKVYNTYKWEPDFTIKKGVRLTATQLKESNASPKSKDYGEQP